MNCRRRFSGRLHEIPAKAVSTLHTEQAKIFRIRNDSNGYEQHRFGVQFSGCPYRQPESQSYRPSRIMCIIFLYILRRLGVVHPPLVAFSFSPLRSSLMKPFFTFVK
ncbi:unnamed protein product [Gongylonema pulchrum]|uniref:Uncharacterized protein n=1 Tax=Gongylonema pulchrum TaxID=637853 RepID=A0A3P6S800_9BILA|nr:unnamed protein product [Gongylonema pulchrum]